MTMHVRLSPSWIKVLVITACWTLLLILVYISTYLLIVDLVGLGKLTGSYEFWPDFAGNAVIGVVGGLVGGSLLVFKMNPAYRHRTFPSMIVRAFVGFVLIYLAAAALLVFMLPFTAEMLGGNARAALARGLDNLAANLYTPSFLTTMLIFGLIVAGTQFMLQVNDKFGPGVLWKLLTGRYYHPRNEERVFMFLDLRSSTEIAERIGHERFFELLRELFQDITKPVIDSRGDIYQYVGDEVVITWPVQRGLADANCIECFFRIEHALAARRVEYLDRFGVAPRFKAGLHVGEATVGEIGVVKKDIVFSGDVLNTTSRIQEECNRHRVGLLASSDLLARMVIAPHYAAQPIGDIPLRGKAEALGLSAIRAVS